MLSGLSWSQGDPVRWVPPWGLAGWDNASACIMLLVSFFLF